MEEDDKIICIELKSVKPNAGEMRGEKQKILEAKAALFHSFPDKKIEFYIGFPFDPTSSEEIGYDKERFLTAIIDGKKYYDFSEVLLADELWNFLSSGTQTMQQILDIINAIATPDFKNNYNNLNNKEFNIKKKIGILQNWNLISEIEILKNSDLITSKISKDNKLKRIYNQDMFIKGKWNEKRYKELKKLL